MALNKIDKEYFKDKRKLNALIEEVKGQVVIYDMQNYSRPDLVDLAHALNIWNANQPLSDTWHNAHYKNFIEPIRKHLDQR